MKCTPIRSMRAYCLDCTGGEKAGVRTCSYSDCPLHPYRVGKRPPKGAATTPMRTIRKQCLECCSGAPSEVRKRPANACSIHQKMAATGELPPVNAFSDTIQRVGARMQFELAKNAPI